MFDVNVTISPNIGRMSRLNVAGLGWSYLGFPSETESFTYSSIFPSSNMPKQAIPPKSRSKSHSQSVRGSLSKQLATSTSKISKKPKGNSKSMKLKNEALSEQLDDLFGELTPHLTSKTQKKKKTLDSQRADLVSDSLYS